MLQRSFDEVSLTWRVPCLVIDGLVIVEVLHGDAALFRQLCTFIFRGKFIKWQKRKGGRERPWPSRSVTSSPAALRVSLRNQGLGMSQEVSRGGLERRSQEVSRGGLKRSQEEVSRGLKRRSQEILGGLERSQEVSRGGLKRSRRALNAVELLNTQTVRLAEGNEIGSCPSVREADFLG